MCECESFGNRRNEACEKSQTTEHTRSYTPAEIFRTNFVTFRSDSKLDLRVKLHWRPSFVLWWGLRGHFILSFFLVKTLFFFLKCNATTFWADLGALLKSSVSRTLTIFSGYYIHPNFHYVHFILNKSKFSCISLHIIFMLFFIQGLTHRVHPKE